MIETPPTLENVLEGLLRRIIREEIHSLGSNGNHTGEDRLLDAEEAAKLLSVSPDWLYRKAKKLPFTHRLGPKMLRFSYLGILKWLATRKSHR
jgi:predicted DNA-binding transcriptional regulator AlpA